MYYWVLSQECMYLKHNTCSWLVTCSIFHCRIKTKSKAKTCAQKDKFQFLRRCSRKFLRWAIKPTTCFCMRCNRHVCVKYFVIVDYRAFIFHIKDYITKWWQWLVPSGRTLCIENIFVGIFFLFSCLYIFIKIGPTVSEPYSYLTQGGWTQRSSVKKWFYLKIQCTCP